MSPRADYFRRRRVVLSRRHLCTRCGAGKPKPGAKLCPDCLAVNALKKPTRTPQEIAEEKRCRLHARLDLIEAARLAVLDELDRISSPNTESREPGTR